MPVAVGSVVEGLVTGITHFGAFIELPDGRTGLVHISEIADAYVKDIKEFVKEKETVKVKVLSDKEGKIGLSIRQASSNQSARKSPRRGDKRSQGSFEDKLARFMKESDERLSQLNNNDSKRGGRGTRPAE